MSDKNTPNQEQVNQATSANKKMDEQTLLSPSENKNSVKVNEKIDSLSTLWRQQDVLTVDIELLKAKWDKIRIKQRYYALLDVLSVLFCVAVFYLAFDKFGTFGKLWVYVTIGSSSLCVGYIVWLRRFSLAWSNNSTKGHIKTLKKQLESNIRIAKINRQITWWVVLSIIIFYLGTFYFGEIPVEKLIKKVLISVGVCLTFGPACWIWANKRAKRFERELEALKVSLGEKSSA